VRVPYRYLVSDDVVENLFRSATAISSRRGQQIPREAIALRAWINMASPGGRSGHLERYPGGRCHQHTVFDGTTKLYGVAAAWPIWGLIRATRNSRPPWAVASRWCFRSWPGAPPANHRRGGVINAASQQRQRPGRPGAGSYISIWARICREQRLLSPMCWRPHRSYLPVALRACMSASACPVRR